MVQNDNPLLKILGNVGMFALLYIVLMFPTYVLPYLGSNSLVLNVAGKASGAGLNPMFWLHLGALAALIVITLFRGISVDKQWLIIFPILATIFDLAPALSVIPFVPTVMHLCVIIIGVASKKADVPQTA